MNVSIIIPTLNESAGIGQCLDRASARQPHEIIVVDGGSDDETVAIAQQYDCRIFQCEAGRARQQNFGARQATGDVLLFLHADMWLPRDGLDQIAKTLSNPRIGGGAFRQRIEEEGWLFRMIELGNALRARVLCRAYGDQGIFLRRSTFWQAGGFPDVRFMEDVLLVRKLRRYTSLALLPGPLQVSARRWQKYGPIRQTARNWWLTLAESFGASPDDLARFYPLPVEGAKSEK